MRVMVHPPRTRSISISTQTPLLTVAHAYQIIAQEERLRGPRSSSTPGDALAFNLMLAQNLAYLRICWFVLVVILKAMREVVVLN